MDPAKPSFKEALRALARRRERELEGHPDPDRLVAYLDGELSEAEQERLRDHLAVCRPCAGLVRDLGGLSDREVPEEAARHLEEDIEAGWESLQSRLRGQEPKERRRTGWPLLWLKPTLPFAFAIASLMGPVLAAALMAHTFVRIHAKAALLLLGLTGFAGGLGLGVPEGVAIDGVREISERIEGAEVHTYRVPLRRGDFVRAAVDQQGADVRVTWRDPAGRRIFAQDGLYGSSGIEEVLAVAAESGEHRLEIRKIDDLDPAGMYQVEVSDLRPASQGDRCRARVALLLARAEALRRQDLFADALPVYRQALAQGAADPAQQAEIWYRIGWVYQSMGRFTEALNVFRRVHLAWRGTVGEGYLLNRMGLVHRELRQPKRALDCFWRARRVAIERRLANLEAQADLNLADELHRGGELRRAQAFFRAAEDILAQSSPPAHLVNFFKARGLFHLTLGAPEQALDSFTRALHHARRTGKPALIGRSRTDIAVAHLRLGRYGQAAKLLNRLVTESRGQDAAVLNLRGLVDLEQDQLGRARAWHESALQVAREQGVPWQRAQALANLGYVYGMAGDRERARRCFAEAESYYSSIGDLSAVALVRLGRALVHQRLGSPSEALADVRESLQLVETMRSDPWSADQRASFLAGRHSTYAAAVDILLDLHARDPRAGWDAQALETSDAARARTLQEALASRGADLAAAVDPRLLRREYRLQNEMRESERSMLRLIARRESGPEVRAQAARTKELRQELEIVREEIRHSDPRYASLTRPRPLRMAEIQREILDRETLMLSYTLGKRRSFVWLIGRGVLLGRELPPERDIERLARAAYDDLSRPARSGTGRTPSPPLVELSRILVGPVAGHLGSKRLVIVPDGVLHYVPFAALPDPREPGAGRPLIWRSEVVVLPSASVLAEIRRQADGRRPPPGQIAVLADPVFTSDDQRVRPPLWERWGRTASLPGPLMSDVLRSSRSLGIDRLDRLNHSRKEAEEILALAPRGHFAALGFDANREVATSPQLAQYRMVHFATHGLFNPSYPQLSGIVFSLVDRQGREQDGFLRASEIYTLDLPVDLVVLSACRTALGEDVRGEGLVGLTRGFLYAGASRVVVSLWSVDDRATAELMKRFYTGIFEGGLAPASALRRAQVSMLEDGEWSAPYHWAAFALHGEWL